MCYPAQCGGTDFSLCEGVRSPRGYRIAGFVGSRRLELVSALLKTREERHCGDITRRPKHVSWKHVGSKCENPEKFLILRKTQTQTDTCTYTHTYISVQRHREENWL